MASPANVQPDLKVIQIIIKSVNEYIQIFLYFKILSSVIDLLYNIYNITTSCWAFEWFSHERMNNYFWLTLMVSNKYIYFHLSMVAIFSTFCFQWKHYIINEAKNYYLKTHIGSIHYKKSNKPITTIVWIRIYIVWFKGCIVSAIYYPCQGLSKLIIGAFVFS